MSGSNPLYLDEYTARVWSAYLGREVTDADVRCMFTLRDLARMEMEESGKLVTPPGEPTGAKTIGFTTSGPVIQGC